MNTTKIAKTLLANFTPVADFDWDMNGMQHRTLSCVNHTDLRWVTKNVWERSLHYVGRSDGLYVHECPCPLADLRVIR